MCQSIPERIELVHMQTQSAFNIGPELFYGIQIWRIWWKKYHFKAIFICKIVNSILFVPRCIVKNKHAFGRILKLGDQYVFEPAFK